MKPDKKTLRFFLGANTPQGFVSRFDQLADVDDGWRCYVIKGGPGSGKSTMMKKIAETLQAQYGDIEEIHCSSDVDSLDGIIVPGLKFAIADGTSPHGSRRSSITSCQELSGTATGGKGNPSRGFLQWRCSTY